jgi:hypothetical protein
MPPATTDPTFLFAFLFPYARIHLPPECCSEYLEQAAAFTAWTGLAEFAEQQRSSALFAYHARTAGIALPDDVRLQFQGLALRHQLAGGARAQALAEILSAAQALDLRPVLLKGAAVSRLIYPQPSLRPMRDIDLLAHPGEAQHLYRLLVELGFEPPAPQPGQLTSPRHLEALSKPVGGFQVTVEIHHCAFDPTWHGAAPRAEDIFKRLRRFDLDGLPTETLGLEDMLWHTYQHLVNEEIRLIGIADLIGLAECFAEEIDWDWLRRACPAVLSALALFHSLVPLDGRLVQAARLEPVTIPLQVGKDLQGWPRIAAGQVKTMGMTRFMRETVFPSEWWLRLYYGIKSGRSVPVFRWGVHPLSVVRLALKRLVLRFRPIEPL